MSFQQQPPMISTVSDFSKVPVRFIDDTSTVSVPASWVSNRPQHPFDSDNADYYKHRLPILPTAIYPYPEDVLGSYLRSHTPCLYQHYIPHPDMDMTYHTIDWPCGCKHPKTLQLTDTTTNRLFPHICHDTPTTSLAKLCPQCRLGHGSVDHALLTPLAFITHNMLWYKVKTRRFGEALTKVTHTKRSNCGRKLFLTDRKKRRNGRAR
jgi:hypothetical protein